MGHNTHTYGGAELSGIEQVRRTDAEDEKEREECVVHAHILYAAQKHLGSIN